MSAYLVKAVQCLVYEIVVEAEDEDKAIASVDAWIEDDFKDYQVDSSWQFDVEEF